MSNELDSKVSRAKLLLLKKQHFAFISSMLYKLKYEPSNEVSSMAYDGSKSTMYLNPTWFNSLSDQEACSALAHEALHYALQHDIRMGRKDPQLYNQAADHVVNNILMDYGFELPDDVPVDRRFQNKTTEYVYKVLWEDSQKPENQNQNNDPPPDNPFGNDIIPNPTPSPQQQSQRNREVLSAGQNDDNTVGLANGIGTSSESFKELFNKIQDGTKSWRDILLEFINEKSQGERSWQQLDRRMLQLGYYMPSNVTDNRINRIAVAIDISGSVSKRQVNYFLRETKSIKNNCNPELLDIVSFNTEITGKWTFKEDETFDKIEIPIDGGTSLNCVWDHYSSPTNKPTFLVVFSDMFVSIPDKPDYEVIWCVVDNPKWKPPYGKAIYINKEDYVQ